MSSAVAPELQQRFEAYIASQAEQDVTVCQQVLDTVLQRKPDAQTELAERLSLLQLLSADTVTASTTLLVPLLEDKRYLQEGLVVLPEPVRLQVQQLLRLQDYEASVDTSTGQRAEGLRRLLLALVEDVRVVLVALINQLLALRHVEPDSQAARQLAEDTQLIHAPLANRLGIWQLKWELEDLSFRYAEPDTYRRIARMLAEGRKDREAFIASFLDKLKTILKENKVNAQVTGRPKHIYSIWRKMHKKKLSFEQLFDIRAVRILVDDVKDCYAVLGLAHMHWIPVPGEFDDYIRLPKGNNYQSLHTAVTDTEGRVVEIQIRTHAMHEHAELGVAAHWRYKEGSAGDSNFERKVVVMRQLLEAGDDDTAELDDQSLLDSFQSITSSDRVYVLTPKGEVQDLSAGSTVLDFAYNIHSNIGHRCSGAKVNDRIVPLTHVLQTGQRVEILTRKLPQPSRDWMQEKYLFSARNRAVVRRWFRQADYAQNLRAGKESIEAELNRTALNMDDLPQVLSNFHARSLDDLFASVGAGDITSLQVAGALSRLNGDLEKQPGILIRRRKPRHPRNDTAGVHIQGVGNLLYQLAQCCKPLPGDTIVGYITQTRGVSIHRASCSNARNMQIKEPARIVEVSWGEDYKVEYDVAVIVEAYDRKTLLKDISAEIASADVSVADMRISDSPDGHTKLLDLTLRIREFEQLSDILSRLLAIPNVIRAQRRLE